MHTLASFLMQGRVQAIGGVVGLALLALKIPPFAILTAAGIALVTLVHGYREGWLNFFVSTAILAVYTVVFLNKPLLSLELVLMYLLPAWLLAGIILARTSMSLAIVTAATLNCILVFAFYIFTEPSTYWLDVINKETLPLLKEAGLVLPEGPDTEKFWVLMSKVLTGAKLASFFVVQIVSLLLARYWQALLYNPKGFGQEFRQIHFGKIAANVALVIIVLAITTTNELALNLFFVVTVLMMFQGLAVIHNLVAKCKLSSSLLVGVYVLMLFTLFYGAVGLLLVAMIGLLDNWLNLRFRLCANKAQDDLN